MRQIRLLEILDFTTRKLRLKQQTYGGNLGQVQQYSGLWVGTHHFNTWWTGKCNRLIYILYIHATFTSHMLCKWLSQAQMWWLTTPVLALDKLWHFYLTSIIYVTRDIFTGLVYVMYLPVTDDHSNTWYTVCDLVMQWVSAALGHSDKKIDLILQSSQLYNEFN